MKCPKCGSENLCADVTVVVPFMLNGDKIGETTYDFKDIYEQVASSSSDDIQIYCYDCGGVYPVRFKNYDGELEIAS